MGNWEKNHRRFGGVREGVVSMVFKGTVLTVSELVERARNDAEPKPRVDVGLRHEAASNARRCAVPVRGWGSAGVSPFCRLSMTTRPPCGAAVWNLRHRYSRRNRPVPGPPRSTRHSPRSPNTLPTGTDGTRPFGYWTRHGGSTGGMPQSRGSSTGMLNVKAPGRFAPGASTSPNRHWRVHE